MRLWITVKQALEIMKDIDKDFFDTGHGEGYVR